MATVLNRTTLQLIPSANTPDFPPEEWLINPVLPDCPAKYWKVVGDAVEEMTAEEKAAVDAPPPVVRPDDVVVAYQQFAQAWADTGLAVPADDDAGRAALTAWSLEPSTSLPRDERLAAATDLTYLRSVIDRRYTAWKGNAVGAWDDFLAWAAEQQQQ